MALPSTSGPRVGLGCIRSKFARPAASQGPSTNYQSLTDACTKIQQLTGMRLKIVIAVVRVIVELDQPIAVVDGDGEFAENGAGRGMPDDLHARADRLRPEVSKEIQDRCSVAECRRTINTILSLVDTLLTFSAESFDAVTAGAAVNLGDGASGLGRND